MLVAPSLLLLVFLVSFGTLNAASECGEIPITEWSGTESRRKQPLKSPIDLVVIQHTVSNDCFTDEECLLSVNSLRQHHMLLAGFKDLGYSFVAGGNGKIYEGAGWNHIGAHTLHYNNISIGIGFIGDFREKLPTQQALQAVQDFLACGVENNLLTEDYHVVGHQQLINTLSPGAVLQSEIESWPHWLDNARKVLG
ncbi:peptidoglycan recognition protein-like [Bombyx mandarina]|uniref:Peptidoglycan-recognition protein n=1 Tax=Bombyx mandarina TaxID=7092 RepID=A0A6J2JCT9_BOMMA|nr:peptidoglycan recognition protein-like [Bombyx mandarina]